MVVRKSSFGLVGVLALCIPMLAACAGSVSSAPPTKEQVKAELPEPNLSLWTLPAESYDPPSAFLMDYARDILATPCWNENGLDIPIRTYKPQAPRSVTRSESNYGIFSVEVAQKYGYQIDLDPRVDWKDRQDFWNIAGNLSEEQMAAFDRCAAEADKEVGADEIISWGLSSPTDVPLTPELQAASEKWRGCMAPLGISDLTSDITPEMMPTLGTQQMFGEGAQDVPSWKQIEPSSAEVQIAVHDAKCRDDAKWAELLYPAAWDYEVQIIIDNYEYLSASRAANEEWKKQLEDIVASAG